MKNIALAKLIFFIATVFSLTLRLVAQDVVPPEYDVRKPLEFTGAVTKAAWMNPHARIYMDVKKSDGTVENWTVEVANPETVKQRLAPAWICMPAGEIVKVSGFPAKDGALRIYGHDITFPDGIGSRFGNTPNNPYSSDPVLKECRAPIAKGTDYALPDLPGLPPSLTISAVENPVKTGSLVRVKAVLKNDFSNEIRVGRDAVEDQGGFGYQITVKDAKSEPPPDTKFGRALKGLENPAYRTNETPVEGNMVWIELKPGESVTDIVNVSRLVDLSKPGKYTIHFSSFSGQTHSYVESNTITIDVKP